MQLWIDGSEGKNCIHGSAKKGQTERGRNKERERERRKLRSYLDRRELRSYDRKTFDSCYHLLLREGGG